MNNLELETASLDAGFDDDVVVVAETPLSQSQRSNALSNKITNILSTSYVDDEISEAFRTLDERSIQNTPEARRRLRIDAQKDVIDSNGSIVRDFGRVADVCDRGGKAAMANKL